MIQIKQIRIAAAVLLLAGLWGCLSQIDLPAPATDADNLAITATLRLGTPSTIAVDVTQVNNFSGFNAGLPVSDVTVELRDESGNQVFIPPLFSGRFESVLDGSNGISIESGKSYQLIVTTARGAIYTSSLERLTAVPDPSDLSFEIETRAAINESGNIVDEDFIRFFIDTPLEIAGTSEKAVLKWDVEGVYKFVESVPENVQVPNQRTCYVSQDLQLERPLVFNGKESGKDFLEKQFLIEEPLDHRFKQGFYLIVHQQSITERAYEYWENIRKVVDISGNFFDEPPGKIRGNFTNIDDPSEDVFGYFSAIQEKIIRFYVAPSAIGRNIFPICPSVIASGTEPPHIFCLDCARLSNSTIIRPDYWVE